MKLYLTCLLLLLPSLLIADEEKISTSLIEQSLSVTIPPPSKGEPMVRAPEQQGALMGAALERIGGVVSPLSGTPCLRVLDLTVVGAQNIPLARTYISPYMPFQFDKQFDADCYYRRTYLRQHYQGWVFFPHLTLWYNRLKGTVQLVNADGSTYDFSLSGGKTTLLRPHYALHNLGGQDTPSGQCDPRNIQITRVNNSFIVFSPEGSTRYYIPHGQQYQLQKEVLPNGKILRYNYGPAGDLRAVESLDPEERYVYASLQIEGTPEMGRCAFTGSTGVNATYSFEILQYEGKFRKGKEKLYYQGRTAPLLTTVNSSQYQDELVYHTNPHCLLHSFYGKDSSFQLGFSGFGQGKHAHCRVEKLSLPVGPADTFVPAYNMTYNPPVPGKSAGETIVKGDNGTSTVYNFSKDLLPTAIRYYWDNIPQKTKLYFWDAQQRLLAVELRGPKEQLVLRTEYTYDTLGNPVVEIRTGDLQGTGEICSYKIQRSFSQDGRHLLVREETEEGKITTFAYLPSTNLLTQKCLYAQDLLLIRETFEYDDCNNLVRKSIEDGQTQKRITNYRLRQEAPFLHMPEWVEEKYLEEGEERLLQRTHLTYDTYGNVAEEAVYDAAGLYAYTLFKEYNARGDLLMETNPLGQQRTYTYDDHGRCIATTHFSEQLHEERQYDRQGRLRVLQESGDAGTHNTTYSYSTYDDLVQTTDTYNNAFTYDYHPVAHAVTRTTSPSILTAEGEVAPVVSSALCNAFGWPLSKTDACGNTTTYRYNAYGAPTEVLHPNGYAETFRYSKEGRLAQHTNREGLTITYTYDVLGRMTCKDYGPTLGKEESIYDSFHLVAKSDLEGNTTHYFYDGAGRKIREECCGHTTTYTYDTLGRCASTTQNTLHILFTRDVLGRVVEEKRTDLQGTLLYKVGYTYDASGNKSSTTHWVEGQPAVETTIFDCFGRPILHQDPLGNNTHTTYDETVLNTLGQCVLQVSTTDPLGHTTLSTHDPLGHVVQEELYAEGALASACTKAYDACGNLTDWKEHVYHTGDYQGTQWTHTTYTPDHAIASSTRAYGAPEARTTTYTYTPGGKLATKLWPDGTLLTYTYDPLGYLRTLDSSDGTIQHQFVCNKVGHLVYAYDAATDLTLQRTVDAFGNITHEHLPYSDSVTTYDALNRPTTVHLPDIGTLRYTYDPCYLRKVERLSPTGNLQYTHQYTRYGLDGHLLEERMIHNCGAVQHTYDPKGRQVHTTSPYFVQNCRYDAQDRLVEKRTDGETIRYTYDALSQLTQENAETYGYDSLFNRITHNSLPLHTNDLNERLDHTYDLRGNTLEKEGVHYTYDALNRLTAITYPAYKLHFLYDPLGRRLAKTVFTKTPTGWQESAREHYLYQGSQEIGALTPEGALKTFRILGAAIHKNFPSTIAIELAGEIFAPVLDVQGNICRLINSTSRTLASSYTFTAFGEELDASLDNNPWRYASKRLDVESGLLYFGKRYYDPMLGRWLTTDPAGFRDSLNLYQYALNNPYCYYDPNGEFLFLACIPLAMLFSPAAVTICAHAIALGIGCWGLYEGTKYAVDKFGSPDIFSEGDYQDLIGTAVHKKIQKDKNSDSTKKGELDKNGNHEDPKKRSAGYLQKRVEQDRAPTSIERVNKGRTRFEKDHVHFKDGPALNSDGTWKHGGRDLTRQEIEWLQENGWSPPEVR